MGTVKRDEIRAVILVAAGIMAVTLMPYLAGLQMAPPGSEFAGFIWGVDDGNVYLSWIRQASEGRVFLANQYTTHPQAPHFFNLFLLVAGWLSRLTTLAPIYIFHALRFLGGIFALTALYWLVSLLTQDRWIRCASLGLAALGSGLGWIVALFDPSGSWGIHPVDVGVNWQVQPEAVTFVSALLNPLFITSMGLICLVLGFSLVALEKDDRKSGVIAGICLLVLGNVHSYDIFAIHLTLGLWIIYSLIARRYTLKDAASSYGIIFAISIPAPLWSYYAAGQDPSYMVKAMTPTPAAGMINYIVGYGLIGLLALLGAVIVAAREGRHERHVNTRGQLLRFAVAWAVANSLVLLLPVSFQRKMVEGLHLPLAILAGVGTAYLGVLFTRALANTGEVQRVRERMAVVIVAVIVLCVPSNVLFVSQCLDNVRTNNRNLLHVLAPPVFVEEEYIDCFNWVSLQTGFDDVILSSSLMGSHLPAHAPCRVFAGHWAETLSFPDKLGKVHRFFRPDTPPDVRKSILASEGVSYIIYGPYERLVGRTAQEGPGPKAAVNMVAGTDGAAQQVFDSGEVVVYEVK